VVYTPREKKKEKKGQMGTEKQKSRTESAKEQHKGGNNQRGKTEKMPNEQADVYKTDQTIMTAGHYFNVKASRENKFGSVATMGDKEIGVEVPSLEKEGSFCLEGDWRVRQARR
jgi:sRNA-binding protein